MNDHHDPLEAELAALKPEPPSQYLKERLAERLSGAGPVPADRRWTKKSYVARLAIAGGVIAASVVAALLLRQRSAPVGEPEPPAMLSGIPVAAAFDDSLPSVWAYRRALGRSLQEFDTLLDKHAAGAASANLDPAPVLGFTRFDARMNSQLGEL
jgi:hypothetical protein